MEGYCGCGSSSGGLDISHVWLFVTPRTPGPSVSHHPPKFAQVHVHCISDAIQPFHLLMPSSPSALNLSQHQGLFNESTVCIRWPKYWSISFSISPSNKYSGLLSLKMDWFDLLAVQGTFSSLLINSLSFCLLYSPAVITVYNHWEDHSLDYIDLCQQSNVSTFQHTV